jgi:hypothetical protein
MRLQWTHRLRDYFAKEKYYVEVSSAATLGAISEVEIVHELPPPTEAEESTKDDEEWTGNDDDTAQPATRKRKAHCSSSQILSKSTPSDEPAEEAAAVVEQPTFEQFSRCYQGSETRLLLRTCAVQSAILASLVARHEVYAPLAGTSFHALCQNRSQFSVVWFSDAVFMSSLRFTKRGDKEVDDYYFVLVPRNGKSLCVRVYTIPSLAIDLANKKPKKGSSQKPAPSLAPITFLASLVSHLPADYFASIHFVWRREDCPHPVVRFLSLVPPHVVQPALRRGTSYDRLTTVAYYRLLSPRLIDAVLKYCGENRLSVRHHFEVPLGTGVNTILRQSPHLRHIHVPKIFFSQCMANGTLFTANGHIESMSVDFCDSGSRLLEGISRSRSLKRLYLRVHVQQYRQFLKVHSYFLNKALSGVSTMQEIIIFFHDYTGKDMLQSVFQTLDLYCGPGPGKLCHFSIMTGPWSDKRSWFVIRKGTASSDVWDKMVSPRLALNWYCMHHQDRPIHGKKSSPLKQDAKERSQENMVSWKVRAVNLGIVYRKTTHHSPHDLSTVNACLLFAILRYSS